MKKDKPYAELVAQAQEAVVAVKDAELRNIAFKRILDDLLSIDSESPHKETAPPKAKRKGEKRTSVPKVRKGQGPKGLIEELVKDGFFKQPKTIVEVKAELANRGHHIPLTSLSGPLQKLCREKKLRREPGKGKGKKQAFFYSNW